MDRPPAEICIQIVDSLDDVSLLSLARTCRYWTEPALRALYTHIVVQSTRSNLTTLLLKLAEPQIGAGVRGLYVFEAYDAQQLSDQLFEDEDHEPEADSEIWHLAQMSSFFLPSCIRNRTDRPAADVAAAITARMSASANPTDLFLACALLLCPNLTDLLAHFSGACATYLPKALAAVEPMPLGKLQRLNLERYSCLTGLAPRLIPRLPKLEHVSMSTDLPIEEAASPEQHSWNIKSLDLSRCEGNGKPFDAPDGVLAVCTALESLRLRAYGFDMPDIYFTLGQEIYSMLARHRKSLQTLHLTYLFNEHRGTDPVDIVEDFDVAGGPATFRAFPRLAHLRTHATILFGANCALREQLAHAMPPLTARSPDLPYVLSTAQAGAMDGDPQTLAQTFAQSLPPSIATLEIVVAERFAAETLASGLEVLLDARATACPQLQRIAIGVDDCKLIAHFQALPMTAAFRDASRDGLEMVFANEDFTEEYCKEVQEVMLFNAFLAAKSDGSCTGPCH